MPLDYTALACFERCPQEWVWRHQRHLVPAAPSLTLLTGSAVHAGARALWAGASVAEAQEAARACWRAGNGPEPTGSVLIGAKPTKGAKPQLTLARVVEVVAGYAAAWFAGAGQRWTCVWNERYAEAGADCGIPDRAVRAADGLLYAMDLKTTSMTPTLAWQRRFEHSQQVAIQLDLLEAVLGEPVAGFWLDSVYLARSGPVTAEHFARFGPIAYAPELRAELRAQRRALAARMAGVEAGAVAEKHTEHCQRYNALCPYFEVCRAVPAEREALVQLRLARGEWKEEPWRPAERA